MRKVVGPGLTRVAAMDYIGEGAALRASLGAASASASSSALASSVAAFLRGGSNGAYPSCARYIAEIYRRGRLCGEGDTRWLPDYHLITA